MCLCVCVLVPCSYHNRADATKEVLFKLNGQTAFRTGDMGT